MGRCWSSRDGCRRSGGHNLEQAIAAGILLGAVIGALSCSLLSEKWGRHRTILLICAFFNAGGLQLMGWLTGSEIYPLAVRAAGTSVQSATLWGTNLLITLTLLTMIDLFGVGQLFWIYALFNVAAWLFVWRRMLELTGHSLEDIERHLQDGNFRPADFRDSARSG